MSSHAMLPPQPFVPLSVASGRGAPPDKLPLSVPNLQWDIWCRVVDNLGDIGVCWRLSANLAQRGQAVRLWCDDLSALPHLAPGAIEGRLGVEVRAWPETDPLEASPHRPPDVVVEAFACDPPAWALQRMAQSAPPPVWLNLEYLSAEAWVERCHGLPSPQWHGPAAGLTKTFFHPGFTPATGGLLREPDLPSRQARFQTQAFRQQLGLVTRPDEILVTLFSYPQPALGGLLSQWSASGQKVLLAATPGYAQAQLAHTALPPGVRTVHVPWLSQWDFDHLLWASDLNLVRGEDSAVRAIWAGRPFLWQLYVQEDGAHRTKAEAFLQHWQVARGSTPWPAGLNDWWRRWNDPSSPPLQGTPLPPLAAWQTACLALRSHLLQQEDLVSQLLRHAMVGGLKSRAFS